MAARRACSKGLGPFSDGLRMPDPHALWPGLVLYAAAHAKLPQVRPAVTPLRAACCTQPQGGCKVYKWACAPLGYAAVQLNEVVMSSAGASLYLNLSISDTLHARTQDSC